MMGRVKARRIEEPPIARIDDIGDPRAAVAKAVWQMSRNNHWMFLDDVHDFHTAMIDVHYDHNGIARLLPREIFNALADASEDIERALRLFRRRVVRAQQWLEENGLDYDEGRDDAKITSR
jgi:hypothetical protein